MAMSMLLFCTWCYVLNGLANISYHCARISFLSEALQLLPVKVIFPLNFTYSLVIDMFHVLQLHSLFTTDTNQIEELQHISI